MKILKISRQESEVTDLSNFFPKRPFPVVGIFTFFFLLFAALPTLKAQTTVNPGDDLSSIIKNSSGGTIILNSGTYGPLLVQNKKFTAANPLILKAAGNGVIIKRGSNNWNNQNPNSQSYDAAVFTQCSYIAIDGVKFIGGDRGVTVHRSDHMIFRNCEFTQTLEAGVKVEDNSEYIDFISCLFAYTGLGHSGRQKYSWFGEALYVGRGSYTNNTNLFPDATKYVWIEGCEFHHTGRGEAVNIKAEVFHCTVRNNYFHDITLNHENSNQTNEGAISLDHTLGLGDNYRVGERRENWVENNRIEKVRTGKTSQRIAGIYSAGTGNNIVGNTVNDVTNGSHTATANGILFNNWNNDNTKNVVWNNTANSENGDDLANLADNKNPGNNPNSAQGWYPSGGGGSNSLSWNPKPTSISNGNNQVTLDYSMDRNGILMVQVFNSGWNLIGQVHENVSAGTRQVTMTLPAENPSANNHIQAKLLNPSWGDIGVSQLQEKVPLGSTPSSNSLSWNPKPTSISNGNNQVTLDYSMDRNGILMVQVFNSGWNLIGQVHENVSAGTRQVTMTLPAENPSANNHIQAKLLNPSWGDIGVSQLQEKVTLGSTPVGNSLSWNSTPTNISNGNNQVTLNYSIDQSGILMVQVYDSNWKLAGQVHENVSAGTSQSTLTLSANGLSASNNHLQAKLLNPSWKEIGVQKLYVKLP